MISNEKWSYDVLNDQARPSTVDDALNLWNLVFNFFPATSSVIRSTDYPSGKVQNDSERATIYGRADCLFFEVSEVLHPTHTRPTPRPYKDLKEAAVVRRTKRPGRFCPQVDVLNLWKLNF